MTDALIAAVFGPLALGCLFPDCVPDLYRSGRRIARRLSRDPFYPLRGA